MRKICMWSAIGTFLVLWLIVSYIQFKSITTLKDENRILKQNGRQLIMVNAQLSQNVSNINNVIIEKAQWDKDVAAKIRELDGIIKNLQYENKTKIISNTIPRMQ